jgi:hypothetical protein
LKELVEEYIGDGSKPDSQLEPRFGDCYDKNSIVDELYLSLSLIENIKTIENLRRVTRLTMKMGEEHANKFKRVKVVANDIAFAFDALHSAIGGHVVV